MSKASLVLALKEYTAQKGKPLSGRFLEGLTDEVFRHVNEALRTGQSFRYPGFGRVFLRQRGARVFHSALHGGNTYNIPAKNIVSFRASRILKAAVQEESAGGKA